MFAPNPGIFAAGASAAATGQVLYSGLTSGSFVVPEGVFSICAVAIGRGGANGTTNSGGGGALSYKNVIPVTPGETLAYSLASASTELKRGTTVLVSAGGATAATGGAVGVGDASFKGGDGNSSASGVDRRGAGAGGYTSVGGNSGTTAAALGGGGSDVFGRVLSGAAAGGAPTVAGQDFGGGAGKEAEYLARTRGAPALRIIWGSGRAFPNTLTEDMT